MKVVFIGACGHTGQAYDVLSKRADVELCGFACGCPLESHADFPHPEVPVFESYVDMLDRVRPDLAVVSPVFGKTGEGILACAERGIDVFSEKPVAGTLEELERVERAVRASGIRFSAMHYLRVAPAFWQGARMVRAGAIGEVRMLTAQKSYRYGTRPAWYADRALFTGIIPWVGIHAIDWVYAFSGKRFLSVDAQCFGSPEMAALCRYSMEDGVMASVNLDYYRPAAAPTHGDDRIRCVGTAGVLEVMEDKIRLIDASGAREILPDEAPELLESFLAGEELLSPDEIFYLTRVALLSREAADNHATVIIP